MQAGATAKMNPSLIQDDSLLKLARKFLEMVKDIRSVEAIELDVGIHIMTVCNGLTEADEDAIHDAELRFMEETGRGYDFHVMDRRGQHHYCEYSDVYITMWDE